LLPLSKRIRKAKKECTIAIVITLLLQLFWFRVESIKKPYIGNCKMARIIKGASIDLENKMPINPNGNRIMAGSSHPCPPPAKKIATRSRSGVKNESLLIHLKELNIA
jgi:hypothetical protein